MSAAFDPESDASVNPTFPAPSSFTAGIDLPLVSLEPASQVPRWQMVGDTEIPDYQFDDLRDICDLLARSQVNGMPGVYEISGSRPGPTLGITVCTHGNEPSGLAVVEYLLHRANIHDQLERGSVLFVLNNIEAARASFAASDFMTRLQHRFVDHNMNRLPHDVLESGAKAYEFRRARELLGTVYSRFDAAIDVHSTSSASPPMLIDISNGARLLYHGSPVHTILSGYKDVATSLAVAQLYGSRDYEIPSFVLEAGSHEDSEAFRCAIRSVSAILHKLGMLKNSIPIEQASSFLEYRMIHGLRFPQPDFEFERVFTYFETLAPKQIIARNHSQEIRCGRVCKITFNGPTKKIAHPNEEAAFLLELPKVIELSH